MLDSTSGHEPQEKIVPTALQSLAQNGQVDLEAHELIAVVKTHAEFEQNEHRLLQELEAHLFIGEGPKLVLIFRKPADFGVEKAVGGILDVTKQRWSGYDGPITTLTREWCEALDLKIKEIKLSPDLDEAVQFLQMYAPHGPWVLSAIKEEWGKRVPSESFSPGDEARMRLWVTQMQDAEANVYFLAAEPNRALRKKAAKPDMKQSFYAWTDIDLGNSVDWKDTQQVNAEMLNTVNRIEVFQPSPSFTIFSGGGLQLFWRLSEPFQLTTDSERESFEAINKALINALGGDKTCFNVDRIMRLPGTVNFLSAKKRKLGRTPMLTGVIGHDPDRVYKIDSFDWLMDDDRDESRSTASGLSIIDQMQARMKAAPKTIEEWANAALDPAKHDRSEVRASVAYRAFNEGRAVGEVIELFHGNDIASGKSRELLTKDVQRLHKKWHTDVDVAKSQEEHATDLGNAKRLVSRHGKDIRFVYGMNTWMIWKNNHWHIDRDGEIQRLAKDTVTAILAEAVNITDNDKREKAIRHGLASQKASRISDMISLARSEKEVVLSHTQLDADPWLLGVKNGMIELKTGTFREARREDYVTKRANVAYDLSATCHGFEAFLTDVMDRNIEAIRYLQRFIGYTLTGSTVEEVMMILWGTGNNGKTTFRETISELMGDYAMAANAGLMVAKRDASAPAPDVVGLKGKRLVTINETAEDDKLAEARVKYLTGTDTITARGLYQDNIEFRPTHKTALTTNHKPTVQGTDTGIWRRIHLVPFTVDLRKKTKGKVIKNFREEKLLPEMSGILNWALRGLRDYLHNGLNPPSAVLQATQAYREDMNMVLRWAEERTEKVTEDHFETTAKLYGNFEQWSKTETPWPLKNRKFSDRLNELGFKRIKKQGERGFVGIKLRPMQTMIGNIRPRSS